MCIIVLKPRKVAMPKIEVLERCFVSNPNGAGFMYRDGGKIHISKGHMTIDALMGALNIVEGVVDLQKTDLTIHFRISTTGSSVPHNCHPFPLSNEMRDLKALNIVCDRAIAHNGVLRDYATFHHPDTDISDTAYFAKMLSGVNDRFIQTVVNGYSAGNRFVYMNGDGKTISFGMHKNKGCGLYYSNESYRPPVATIYDFKRNSGNTLLDSAWSGAWAGVVGKQTLLEVEKEELWQEMVAANRTLATSTCDDSCINCKFADECIDKKRREHDEEEARAKTREAYYAKNNAFMRNHRRRNEPFVKYLDGV